MKDKSVLLSLRMKQTNKKCFSLVSGIQEKWFSITYFGNTASCLIGDIEEKEKKIGLDIYKTVDILVGPFSESFFYFVVCLPLFC